jgi:beta-lactamase regulating signal transducer with metallopeptidase domain
MIAWVVYGILVSSALSVGALAFERACRVQRWPSRWAWAVAIALPLVLPLFAPQPSAIVTVAGPSAQSERTVAMAPAIQNRAASIANDLQRFDERGGFGRLMAAGWLAASVLLIAAIALASLRLRRKLARWRPHRLCGVDVLVSRDAGPAVVGFFQSRIVVPEWLLHADVQVQRTALAHERQHIAARDPLLLFTATLLIAVLPWNIPLWWQWRRLRFAIEADCDARVLGAGMQAADYGEALLKVAGRRAGVPLLSPAMCESASRLEARVRLMLTERAAGLRASAAALIGVALTIGAAAAQISAPATQESGAARARTGIRAAFGTELMEAAEHGELAAAVELIQSGADVNHVILGDGAPMIVAARRGDLPLVKLLLQHGANVNIAVPGDGNPLIVAAGGGHMAVVTTLIEHGADLNGIVIGDETPLINAARAGHFEIVRYLVERGADVNLTVPSDAVPFAQMRSPLSEATKHRRQDVVEYLRARGART